jgi:hypothetical protein
MDDVRRREDGVEVRRRQEERVERRREMAELDDLVVRRVGRREGEGRWVSCRERMEVRREVHHRSCRPSRRDPCRRPNRERDCEVLDEVSEPHLGQQARLVELAMAELERCRRWPEDVRWEGHNDSDDGRSVVGVRVRGREEKRFWGTADFLGEGLTLEWRGGTACELV